MALNTDIPPPFRGVSDRTAFSAQAVGLVPPDSLRNVRPDDVSKRHGRVGQRAGTKRFVDTQICGGAPIQLLATVSRASRVTGYQAVDCADVTVWEPRDSFALEGQCWMLGSAPSMFRDFADGRGGTSTNLGVACKWHPLITNDIRRAFYSALFNDVTVNGGADFSAITCVDELGAVLWTANLEDKQAGGALPGSPRAIYANHVNVVAPTLGSGHVLISVLASDATTQQGYLYVFDAASGAYLKRYDMRGFAGEVQQTAIRTDGKIAVLFWGTGGTATEFCLDGTPITPGGFSMYFRSGIALFELSGDAADPLRDVGFQGTTAPGVKVENLTHGHWRFSEKLLGRRPWGAYPTSIAAGPDNRLVVTFTNKGWGPNASYPPADNATYYSTVALLAADGTVEWEADTDSIRRAYVIGVDTYYNDIPLNGDAFGTKPPSLFACAVGLDGTIFVGGARNSSSATATAGFNLFALSSIDGRMLWRTNMGGAAAAFSGGVAQGGLCIDPADGNLIVAGYRGTAWTGAATRNAHLWKINKDNGAVIWHYDLREAVNAYSVDCDSRGRIVYTTAYVT